MLAAGLVIIPLITDLYRLADIRLMQKLFGPAIVRRAVTFTLPAYYNGAGGARVCRVQRLRAAHQIQTQVQF